MLKCMYSQNWWLDHTTSSPCNVICDLLFYNKLPYHVILTRRSNHACKKESNYNPLLSKKPSSIPRSSLYTMQWLKSIVNFLPEILDCGLKFWPSVATKISSEWFCCLQQMHFCFLQLVVKLFLMRNRYWLFGFDPMCLFMKRARCKSEECQNDLKREGTVIHSQIKEEGEQRHPIRPKLFWDDTKLASLLTYNFRLF